MLQKRRVCPQARIEQNMVFQMPNAKREEPCAAPPLPDSLSARLEGYDWTRNVTGQSGGGVFRLGGNANKPDLFLKTGEGSVANDLTDEMVRMIWLGHYITVPTVECFVRTPDEAWLLMTAIRGVTAYQMLEESTVARLDVVDALATFLRRLHSLPIADCPFNSGHSLRLALAKRRIECGFVDVSDFDEEREGWTAQDVWAELQEEISISFSQVVTHGDFSLDNILFHNGDVVGCIDGGRVGVADPYQDIAILWNCLGEFGAELQERLIRQYGITELDHRRLKFHLLLDELF